MSGAVVGDVVAALAGVGAGLWGGFRLGMRWGSPSWRYWLMNAGALVACLGICALSLTFGARWLAVLVLGVLGGLLTGMKYGIRGGFVMHPGVPASMGSELDADADGSEQDNTDVSVPDDAVPAAEGA